MGKPTILIVIPTYGHFDYAERAVRSAVTNTKACLPVVTVVDDASPDWSQAWAEALTAEIPHLSCQRFDVNGGLTRSWNQGFGLARCMGLDYTCVTNSDVVFTPGWDVEILHGLSQYALAGPVTNAPGTSQDQYVGRYSLLYRKQTAEADADKVQAELAASQGGRFKPGTLNGFCMIAKTSTWVDNAYDDRNVFNPRNDFNSKGERNPTPLMTLNEYELQRRWHAKGLRSGICLGSYVLHYRAVSRGDRFKKGDWVRTDGDR